MKADDSDPMRRWQSISEWYVEFAAMSGWEFLHPMVALTAWAGKQPFASQLYPGTSHEYLCVHLLPGYNPDQPFFSCGVGSDGQFRCELWARVSQSACRKSVPIDQAQSLFVEFVSKLVGA